MLHKSRLHMVKEVFACNPWIHFLLSKKVITRMNFLFSFSFLTHVYKGTKL